MVQQGICTSLAILIQDLVPQLSLVYSMAFLTGLSELWVPSRGLQDHDERAAIKATEVIKKALWATASALITKSEGRPVMYSYSSDGTRLTTTTTFRTNVGFKKIQRSGSTSHEFLQQVGYLKTTNSLGQPIQSCLMRDPVPLDEGQSTFNEYTAFREFFTGIRRQGHMGIIVNHVAWGRAVFSAMQRKVRNNYEK